MDRVSRALGFGWNKGEEVLQPDDAAATNAVGEWGQTMAATGIDNDESWDRLVDAQQRGTAMAVIQSNNQALLVQVANTTQ
jgi:hypothetical protein